MSEFSTSLPALASLKLARQPASHTVATGVAIGLMLLITFGLFLGVLLGSSPEEDFYAPAVAAFGGIAAISLLLALLLVRQSLSGRLDIGLDRVTVTHPGMFNRPLVIPLSELRTASVDTMHAEARFPLYQERPQDPSLARPAGVLWRKWGGEAQSPLPYLGIKPSTPNVALVFERPLAAPRVRRVARHAPVRGEALAGLLLTVQDPDAARLALERIERIRPLDAEDWAHLTRNLGMSEGAAPSTGLTRTEALARYDARWAWACAIGGFLFPLLALAGVVGGINAAERGRTRTGIAIIGIGTTALAVRFAWAWSERGSDPSPWVWIIGIALLGALVLSGGALGRALLARRAEPQPQSST